VRSKPFTHQIKWRKLFDGYSIMMLKDAQSPLQASNAA
jgi:hypothetical protein